MNHVESRTGTRLAIVTLAFSLCATAMAQQAPKQEPLTGHMLGGKTPTTQPATTQPAPAQTRPQSARTSATTYPVTRTQQAPRASTQPVAQAQPPMPDYTNLQTPVATMPPAMYTPPPPVFGSPIGPVTRSLLRMQASNTHAVASLPTLGAEATAAYKRYIDSFNYPIPKFLKRTVKSGSGGGSQ